MSKTPYREVEKRFARIGAMEEALGILNWDASTMMPDQAANGRGEQISTLQVVRHEWLTDPRLADLLGEAEAQNDFTPWQRANLTEMRRNWVQANAVPGDLVEALAKASLSCEMVWREARPADDFARVRPKLQELLDLTIEAGKAKAQVLGTSLYDALLQDYEPGGSAAEIDRQFAALAEFLPHLIGTAIDRQASEAPPIRPTGPFPIAAQKQLGERLMGALGFDFTRGRLDVSHHPFSCGTPDDARITCRYAEDDFTRAMMGVLHETGHALYTQGLPLEWNRQPVGAARGMSIHESQSLLTEMQVCRSRAFMEFLTPILREIFGTDPAFDAENLYRLGTRVKRSLIRVDADEATYPAHVILRYRLERHILAGELVLADLPGAWRDGMRELVGIEPPDDRSGCLQDIHWYSGSWGYFPTYTLGAMTAAQLFDAAKRADGSIEPGIARGDFAPLLTWLRQNVHSKASSLSGPEIVSGATGRELEVGPFRRHLEARYCGAV